MTRAKRKLEHIQYALTTGQKRRSGFDDIAFVHQSLPELSMSDIHLNTTIGELSLSSPIFINAMTGGGGENTKEINQKLAVSAREANVAIAVGSQMAAIKDKSERSTYEIVRKENPNGVIFANLGSEATVAQAEMAVEMVEADALQIHLNVVQELTMPEGDRDFKGALDRIQHIASALPIPVFVKETGFGISQETAIKLASAGAAGIDVGGFGGTNFAEIENERRQRKLHYFNDWGIPTAAAIVEASRTNSQLSILGSGGIQHAGDIVKALALGADAAGMAGFILKVLTDEGEEGLIKELNFIQEDMKMLMCSLGAANIPSLQKASMIISGNTYHWLSQRGFNPEQYSRRQI
ncbi:type 2 isopentenyl-diphosphate Delta-isomerase [Falsibacillus albus]|uniref:Isopentenyl-diphosphate delta-isomerase n=1 Tax=Falsibacillus albus TaxID=2478915 RepID=A0A3L7JXU1_9BACI|nr:type 2 isopentenyl-diphosphate Delta-isomerase [Falsibacillus albus]RLQ95084.1 type 2 isopentenyl-diphosphate Delta-isomerase [Falsibacillus albus]